MDLDMEQLLAKINEWNLVPQLKRTISDAIQENQIVGCDIYDLLVDGQNEELETLLNINRQQRILFVVNFRRLIVDYNQEGVEDDQNNEGVQGNINLHEDEFYPLIYINGRVGRATWKVNKTMTILDFKKKLIECEVNEYSKNNKNPEITLIAGSETLQNHRTLEFYGITSLIQISTIVKLNGGALQPVKERIRRPNIFSRYIKGKVTNQKCCICGENEKNKRIKATCGCVFCAPSMFDFVISQFDNLNTTCFKCPMCHKLLSWEVVAAIAGLDNREFNKYTNILKKRQKADQEYKWKNCPFCKNLVNRPDALDRNRVNCGMCKNGDWCFICTLPWKSGGKQICGNSSCYSQTLINMVNNCPITQHGCPSIRGCPKCLTIIEWKQNCAHIKCPNKNCNFDFCIRCLQYYSGHNMSQCAIIPRQVFF